MTNLIQYAISRRESGQTMVEYGLILALVSVVAVATLLLLGPDIKTIFSNAASDF
jgi:pilus assembly protein Flp/PilA